MKGWWREVWTSAWIRQGGRPAGAVDVLPWLFAFMWMSVLFEHETALGTAMAVGLGAIASASTFAALSIVLVGLAAGARGSAHRLDERGTPCIPLPAFDLPRLTLGVLALWR